LQQRAPRYTPLGISPERFLWNDFFHVRPFYVYLHQRSHIPLKLLHREFFPVIERNARLSSDVAA